MNILYHMQVILPIIHPGLYSKGLQVNLVYEKCKVELDQIAARGAF